MSPTTMSAQSYGLGNGQQIIDVAPTQVPPITTCATTFAATIPTEIQSFVTYAAGAVTVTPV